MVMVGAFLGGPDFSLEAGKASISLCVNTTDRMNLDTASFTVTSDGFNETVQADASGRGYIVVPAGKTYNVALNHQGNYENDRPQKVIAENRMAYGVYFDLFDYPSVSTLVTVSVTFEGAGVQSVRVAAVKGGMTVNGVTEANGQAVLRGLDVGTWTVSLPDFGLSKTLEVTELIHQTSFSLGGLRVTLDGKSTPVTITGPKTESKTPGDNGTVTFGPLPKGSYTIQTEQETKTSDVNDTVVAVSIMGKPLIYGVRIARGTADPEARVEYIEDCAGWPKGTRNSIGNWLTGNTPFTGIKPVRLKVGVFTDLNKRDLTKTVDGASSEINKSFQDAFVEVPTWWLSITTDGTYDYVRFSDRKMDDTYKKLASLWKGKDVGMFHYGIFHAYYENYVFSISGKVPTNSASLSFFTQECQKRGEGYDIGMWHQRTYLVALCLLYFGTTNPQTILRGYVDGSSVDSESISTFDNDLGLAGSTSGAEHMAFLWINDFWGNVYEFVGGAKTDANFRLMTLDNGEPNNVTGEGYVTHDTIPQLLNSGYISEMDCQSTEVGFLPTACEGSETTFWADYGYIDKSNFFIIGSSWNYGNRGGPFYATAAYTSSENSPLISARLSYRAGRVYP